jgi:hypothetical protein
VESDLCGHTSRAAQMIRKDRAALVAELKAEGWQEDPTKPGRLRAPPTLVRRLASRTFHLYEADILHQIVFAIDEGALMDEANRPRT